MARTTGTGWLAGALLLAAACEEEPIDPDAALGDAAGPVTVDAGPFDAQQQEGGWTAPGDSGVPTVDTGVAPPPGDAGVAAPLDAGGDAMGDTAAALPDAQAGDGSAPAGDASTPGFPSVTDTGATGPYTPRTIEGAGPGGVYTIYHPAELAPGGALNPIVSWGNGGFTAPSDYPLLPHLASHGFVVIAANNLFVSGPEVRSGVDWMVQQNEAATSPFYKKLDVQNVAGVGYSFGGLATLEVADDPRYVTIVIISGANTSDESRVANTPKLHTPTAYLCTDDDDSEDNCAAEFLARTNLKFGARHNR